jgi:hypothetical protein
MAQVAEKDVERNGGAGVAEMGIAVNGRTTDVKPDAVGMQRDECFFLSTAGVVNNELLFHDGFLLISMGKGSEKEDRLGKK